MIVGQSFLVIMMALKEAYGACSLVAISIGIITRFSNKLHRIS